MVIQWFHFNTSPFLPDEEKPTHSKTYKSLPQVCVGTPNHLNDEDV